VLIVGILIFVAGSMLCGLAGEFGDLPLLGNGMTQLIVFRALQGIGGGALFTSAFGIIADLFAPRERAKFAGMFGAVFGLASLLGPVIGGFFTDLGVTHFAGYEIAGWRWVFYVNLPVSALALFMIYFKMPVFAHHTPGKIDFVGAALIVIGVLPLLLALTWGGRDYAWSSPQIVALLALAVTGLVAFVFVEGRVSNPILPLSLFRNRVFVTANAAAFVSAMAFMGSVAFLPLYMQLGQGVKATTSGLSMLPMMLGLFSASAITGQLVTRTGKYKPFMLAGGVLIVFGLFLISRVTAHTTTMDLAWRMLIFGFGLGPSMSTFNIAIQNAVGRMHMGVATSSAQFFRQIGGLFGVALFGAVLTHNVASIDTGAGKAMNLTDLQGMAAARAAGAALSPAELAHEEILRAGVTHAVTGIFLVAIGVALLAIALTWLIPALPLAHHGPNERPATPPEPA
jgi:EmrB/QacA subfamily drug resistance transporter